MDIGYYLNWSNNTIWLPYWDGYVTHWVTYHFDTSLAASLVPAVSEAHAQGNVNRIVQRGGNGY